MMKIFIKQVFIFLVTFPIFSIAEEFDLVCEGIEEIRVNSFGVSEDVEKTVILKIRKDRLIMVKDSHFNKPDVFMNEEFTIPTTETGDEIKGTNTFEVTEEKILGYLRAVVSPDPFELIDSVYVNRYNGKFKIEDYHRDIKTLEIIMSNNINGVCKKGKQAF